MLLLLAILVATLMPSPGDAHLDQCLLCGGTLVADVIVNVVLYVPLAVAARAIGWSRSRVLVSGAALSASIELAQLFIIGRHATPVDVLANVAGVAVGIALVDSSRWWLRPPRERAGWLSLLAAAFALVAFALTGYLLSPALPQSTYYGQWTVEQFGLERYEGRVLSASIGPLDIPPHVLLDSDSARTLLLADAPLRMRVVGGAPPPGLAPIVSIADEQYRRVALLGADRSDLVFSLRRHASALRLYAPQSRMVGAMAEVVPADTITIVVERGPERSCTIVDGRRSCREPPTLGMGWAFLTDSSAFPPWARLALSAIWTAVLALPVGFWARRGWIGGAGSLLVLCGVAFAPAILIVGPSGPAEYVGLFVGLAVGLFAGRRVNPDPAA